MGRLIPTLAIFILSTGILPGQNCITIKVGDSEVNFDCFVHQNDTVIFLNLHNNEETSIAAVQKTVFESSGKYFGIQTGGKRELTVSANGQLITFDPNRIFTKAGIEKTLKHFNCYSENNFKLVDTFARNLLGHLSNARLLVAVHNSADAGFSINSISADHSTKKDAAEIHINETIDEDDFYLVTTKNKYDYLKALGYNVVLQDNTNVEDDGSLSVYCGRKNIDYINIECQFGHLNEQIQMIDEIYQYLRDQSEQIAASTQTKTNHDTQDNDQYAVILGYKDRHPHQTGSKSEVSYVLNDTKAFKQYAGKTLTIPAERIILLSTAQPLDWSSILNAVNITSGSFNHTSSIAFYYAAHGFPDKQNKAPYLIPVDVRGSSLKHALELRQLCSTLTKFPAKILTAFQHTQISRP